MARRALRFRLANVVARRRDSSQDRPVMAALLVQSEDGTAISSEVFGVGRPLVVVSGALFASALWQRAASRLVEGRSLVIVDRRGRGKSTDQPVYSPEREVEDLLAVLAALPGSVDLLGHSSGAILALQAAARRPPQLDRLVVYEPPVFFAASDRIPQDLPERLAALVAAGQLEAAVETFFREGPRTPERELSSMKAGPSWAPMVQNLARTVPYDAHVQRSFAGNEAELSRVETRTLVLLGADSPERMQSGSETVAARLPNARLCQLLGQQHVAMLSDPLQFAARVSEFLAS